MNQPSRTLSCNCHKSRWVLGLLFLLWLLQAHVLRFPRLTAPFVVGHRGAAGLAPENTLLGIETALIYPVAYVEIDVRRTQYGEVLLMHDRSIRRTTGGLGRIDTLDRQALANVTVGAQGERIPTLAEALDLVKASGVMLMIEVKAPGRHKGIAQGVIDAVSRAQMTEEVVVASTDRRWLLDLHRRAPDIELTYITPWALEARGDPAIRQVSVQWLSVCFDPTLVWRLHRQGYVVLAWTVNHPGLARWAWQRGVDGVITDRPDLLGDELPRLLNP